MPQEKSQNRSITTRGETEIQTKTIPVSFRSAPPTLKDAKNPKSVLEALNNQG
jgi:hypothetical protein